MEKIKSFTVNHNTLAPGFYLSREDGDISTYDLRFKRPNCGDYISLRALHTIEHVLATAFRNGEMKNNVIYFGPMGCRTGYCLIMKNTDIEDAKSYTIECIKDAIAYECVPGAKKIECGNYRCHSLKSAKTELEEYLKILTESNG